MNQAAADTEAEAEQPEHEEKQHYSPEHLDLTSCSVFDDCDNNSGEHRHGKPA
jgi:hypothetical protein